MQPEAEIKKFNFFTNTFDKNHKKNQTIVFFILASFLSFNLISEFVIPAAIESYFQDNIATNKALVQNIGKKLMEKKIDYSWYSNSDGYGFKIDANTDKAEMLSSNLKEILKNNPNQSFNIKYDLQNNKALFTFHINRY